jgi:N-carbamoylputrescine amidase
MPAPETVKIGLLQLAASDEPADNLARTVEAIRRAADQGAQIVCTQELFRSKYFCQSETHDYFDLAEPIPGATTETLGRLAGELGIVLVASLFEKRAPGLYHNTAVIFDADGALLGKYRKMHIPDDPLYYEKFYFTPGDLGFRAWDTRFGRIGVCICWDQWFPEAARATALDGARILFYPTAIGWHEDERTTHGPTQHDSWETIQRSHAIANGVFVAAVNRIGREGTVTFWGQSFVADPGGRVLHRAAVDAEEIIVREINLARVEVQRRHWPFLRDRRIDAYEGLLERFRDRS